jgi:hypothetical protein
MKRSTYMDTFTLQALAKSPSRRLTLEEVEWLCRELKLQAEENRRQAGYESLVQPLGQHA